MRINVIIHIPQSMNTAKNTQSITKFYYLNFIKKLSQQKLHNYNNFFMVIKVIEIFVLNLGKRVTAQSIYASPALVHGRL